MSEFNSTPLASHKFLSQSGSTLIELMVATSVVVIALTALMTTLTLSIKSTAQSKYRTYAASLSQESLEVFRRERSLLGWQTFYKETPTGTLCFNTLPASSTEFVNWVPGACADRFTEVGAGFSRTIVVTKGVDSVTVQSRIDWNDGTQLRDVQLEQVLKEY